MNSVTDSHGNTIERGKPYTLYKYARDQKVWEKDQLETMRNNVDNLAKWFAIQDEEYILEIFSKLPRFAKDKLMKVLK